MKRNVIYIICLCFICLLANTHTAAQQRMIYNGKIRIKPYEFKKQGDSLFVKMDIDLIGTTIENDRYLILTPIVQSPGHDRRLPEIRINGKNRHKVFLREMALMGKATYAVPAPYAVVKSGLQHQQTVNYTVGGRYEDWMEHAQLNIEQDICGCGGKTQQISIEKLLGELTMDTPPPPVFVEEPKVKKSIKIAPYVAFIRPPFEEVKKRSEKRDVFLDFPVNQITIQPGFGSNSQELSKIETVVREIREDKNVKVERVEIVGYASPEGGTAHNLNLSQGRAEALRGYLSMRVNIPYEAFRVEGRGEDWEGLTRMVEESYLPDKGQILSTIQYTYPPERRKQVLKTLSGGRTYQTLLYQFYPKLRRSVCQIDYTVRGFNIEEATNIIKTQPHLLSLQEMYMVANTYPKGSQPFIEIFDTALRIYPQDNIANLNASATAMMRGDMSKALYHLGLSDRATPEYMNNQAAYYILLQQYDQALPLLNQAAALGLKEAQDNLMMMQTSGIINP